MIVSYQGKFPRLAKDVFVANTATITGDVEIGSGSSVWFSAVIRGDMNYIRIGEKVSVQDNCVLHVDSKLSPLILGNEITVGHRSVLHGCKVGNLCLIGMGSIIMDGTEVGDGCIIAAGSVVIANTKIPPRTLVMGIPAKPKREVNDDDLKMIKEGVEAYYRLADNYRQYTINPYSIKGAMR